LANSIPDERRPDAGKIKIDDEAKPGFIDWTNRFEK
jgi:hypothetical protein